MLNCKFYRISHTTKYGKIFYDKISNKYIENKYKKHS